MGWLRKLGKCDSLISSTASPFHALDVHVSELVNLNPTRATLADISTTVYYVENMRSSGSTTHLSGHLIIRTNGQSEMVFQSSLQPYLATGCTYFLTVEIMALRHSRLTQDPHVDQLMWKVRRQYQVKVDGLELTSCHIEKLCNDWKPKEQQFVQNSSATPQSRQYLL